METFRKFVKSWLGKLLLVLFTIPFAFIGVESYFATSSQATSGSHIVNGTVISKEEIDAEINALKQQYARYTHGDESLLNAAYIEKTAINNLVSRQLLLQQAKQLGIALDAEQIKQMIASVPSFQENGQYSPRLYEQYLKHNRLTSDTFINNLRQQQAVEILLQTIMMEMVNSKDVDLLVELNNEQRHIYIANVPLADYQKDVTVTQQELTAYYDQHKQQFTDLANVNVSYVIVKPTDVSLNVSPVTEDDLQTAYQQAIRNLPKKVKHILITADQRSDEEAQKRANEAYAKLQAGEEFADIAKQYSEDSESKERAGLIEGYQTGQYSDEFDRAIHAAQVNKVTAPVKTNFGYHIILLEQDTRKMPSYDSQKATLTQVVQKQKREQALADYIAKINQDVVSTDNLAVVTQAVKTAKIETVNDFTAVSQHPVLSQAVVKARLFDQAVQNGEWHASSNLQLANGDIVWVKVTQYSPAGVQPFEQVTDQVRAKVIEQKASELAKQALQKTLDGFNTSPAKTVLATSQLRFENLGAVIRGQARIPQIQALAFSLAKPKDGYWSVGTTTIGQELWVVAVANVQQIKQPNEQAIREELTKFYANFRVNQELANYLAYLKAQAKIEQK